VRKRTWTTKRGEARESWIVDYVDQAGDRCIQTFERKKDADEYHARVKVDVRQGTHTATSKSITIAEAAEDWIKYVELEGRERSTIEHYRNHVNNHIVPRIGREKLSKLTTPRIQAFRDELLTKLSRVSPEGAGIAQVATARRVPTRQCGSKMLRSACQSNPTREARLS
jgi:hypothetical protein